MKYEENLRRRTVEYPVCIKLVLVVNLVTDTPTPQKIPKEILEITNKMDLMTDTPTSQRIPRNLTDKIRFTTGGLR